MQEIQQKYFTKPPKAKFDEKQILLKNHIWGFGDLRISPIRAPGVWGPKYLLKYKTILASIVRLHPIRKGSTMNKHFFLFFMSNGFFNLELVFSQHKNSQLYLISLI